jgi:hypothetical protein
VQEDRAVLTEPETHYALSGEIRIAYQVVGGPFDLVFVPGYISNLDHTWEEPSLVHLISRLSSFSRLIMLRWWKVQVTGFNRNSPKK